MKKKSKWKTTKLELVKDADDYKIIKPAALFHIYKTQEELEAYFSKYSGDERFLVSLGAMLMFNCLAYQLKGKELKNETDTN